MPRHINNEGALVFSYNLEDIDHLEGGADIFNGQNSVLWKNVRAVFFDDIKAMYQKLRSEGALSYEKVEQMFEDHQEKWPEAVFNEDAWFKYLVPLVEKGNASYLSMLQGSKAEQRKWWLYNRFRYMDSKYTAGDALSDVITVRGYAKADVTLVPYADVYTSVKYGSYLVQARSSRNKKTTLPCPLDNVNDTEIYIYSASQLADVGDLSALMVGYADFSKATRLQALKLGDSADTYSNGNLTELYLGNNELLRTIDVRNCPALTQAVDISGCANIEHVYFDGTSITGLELPNGGILKTLHLPGTLTNLSIRNHPKISDFVLPSVQNLTTVWLENVGEGINIRSILSALTTGTRVRIIGFDWSVSSDSALTSLKETLDKMRGLNESGGNEDKAQLLGTIQIGTVSGANIKAYHNDYPDITIHYTNLNSKCYFYNYNGTSLLYTATVTNGANAYYWGSTPTKPPTISQTFRFIGWSRELDGARDVDAMKNVVEDRYLYPVFTPEVRTYTVNFYTGTTLLQTITDVPYGGSAVYSGDTPTNVSEDDPTDYAFTGWDKEAVNIQGNVNCYAQFRYVGMVYKHLLDGGFKDELKQTTAKEVGYYGLYNMLNLTKITLSAVEKVGMFAFAQENTWTYAKPLQVDLPKATSIAGCAFLDRTTLTKVNLPLAKTIGEQAFSACYALEQIDLPEATSISPKAFQYCRKLKKVRIPKLEESIGQYVFYGCSALSDVEIPKAITSLQNYCFSGCSALEKIVIPENIDQISPYAFENCIGLKQIYFLGKPSYIANTAFSGCTAVTDIYVSWNESAVGGVPWGATSAAIHYQDEGWKESNPA